MKKILLLLLSMSLSAQMLELGNACLKKDVSLKNMHKTTYDQLKKYYELSTNNHFFIQKNCEGMLQFELIVLPTNKSINEKAKVFLSQVKNDAYSIYYKNNTITIMANNNRSLLYGVYSFLQEDLNVQFFTESYEKISHVDFVDTDILNRNSEARFQYREIFSGEVDNPEFAKKMRLNGRFGHRKAESDFFVKTYNAFTPYQLLPPNKYQKSHSSYFCGGQLDFTKKDVQTLASKRLMRKLKKINMEGEVVINLPHQDRKSYCNSRQSKHIIKKYKTPAAPYLLYTESLARATKKYFPNAMVMAEAYQWSRKPPNNWHPLPKNLGIFFSTIEADFSKSMHSKHNKPFKEDLKGWAGLSDNIIIWHYITNYNGYFQPFPDVDATVEDILYWDGITSVNGVFLQGAYGTYGGSQSDLKIWLYSQLLWDPNCDVNALKNEFMSAVYGAAAKDIMAYYALLKESIITSQSRLYIKTSVQSNYLNENFLTGAEKILDRALKKTVHTPAYEEVLKVYAGIDYVRLMRGEISKDAKVRFRKYLKNKNIKLYAEGRSKKELIQLLSMQRNKPLRPKHVPLEAEWIDFQENALKLCCTQLAEDSLASDHATAWMSGSKSDWGFQLALNQLTKGKWKVYASVRIETNDRNGLLDTLKPALYYGVHGRGIKRTKLIGQFDDNAYLDFLVAEVDVKENDTANVWIRPPKDKSISKIFVDRIYVVKE